MKWILKMNQVHMYWPGGVETKLLSPVRSCDHLSDGVCCDPSNPEAEARGVHVQARPPWVIQ